MRSRLIKALNNRFYVKFMQFEIGLLFNNGTNKDTIWFSLNIMTPEKKLCQIKKPDRDSNLQSQKVQLSSEPIVDKIHYITTKPFGHPVSQSV